MRSCSLCLVVLAACAGGGQNQPGGSGLGESASTTGGSTGGDAGETAAPGSSGVDPSGTSMSTSATSTSTSTSGPPTADESGSGDPAGSSSTGASISWQRYSLDVASGTWSQVPLSEIWSGPNAPPSTGIAAAVSFTHFDRLFIVSEDGMVYEQAGGVWQTPEPLAERFPAAADLQVTSMTHTPGQDGDDNEDIYFVDAPTAVVYTQFENGGLELATVVELMDQKNGPAQASVDNDWTLAIADPSGIGKDPDWLQWYGRYADLLWRFNAAFEWTSSPLEDNLYFGGAPGEPDPYEVRAAYYEDTFERAHFIAP